MYFKSPHLIVPAVWVSCTQESATEGFVTEFRRIRHRPYPDPDESVIYVCTDTYESATDPLPDPVESGTDTCTGSDESHTHL